MPIATLRKIPSRSVAHEVREQMKDLVLSGGFRPGEKLPSERDFTEALGVSRTAIREGLRGLEALGLVVIRHGSGVYVAEQADGERAIALPKLPLRRQTAADLIEVRLIVEPDISALAAERATPQDRLKLRLDVEQFRVDIGRVKRPPTDLRFHLDLCKAVHNTSLLAIIRWIIQFYAQSGQMPTPRDVEDHDRIYKAVMARDPATARRAMLDHLKWVQEAL